MSRSAVLTRPEPVKLEMLGQQWDFVHSEARHPALLGGRGAGKTIGSAVKGFVAANQPGAMGVLTSPTYVQVRDNLVPAFRQMFGAGEGNVWEYRRADHEIRFSNGSKILLRPANEPDRLRGLSLAFFGMDEIAIGDQLESFLILQAALRQSGFKQQGWVTSTPHWRRPWIRKIWQDGRDPVTGVAFKDRGDYPIYRAKTVDNTHLPESFVDDLRQMAPSERYVRQELYGEFIDVEGVAFPMFSERTHVRPMPQGAVKKRVCGVDFGGTAPTAVIECVLLENGEIQVSYEFYQRNCTERQLVESLADRKCKVLCDPSGDMAIEMLRRYGINATKARSNRFDLRFRLLAGRLNLINRGTGKVYQLGDPGMENASPGLWISPQCVNLINEIQNLAFASNRQDVPQDKWEQGLADHAFDALCYCLMELDPAGFKVPMLTVRRVA